MSAEPAITKETLCGNEDRILKTVRAERDAAAGALFAARLTKGWVLPVPIYVAVPTGAAS